MTIALVIGANGGIGSACVEKLLLKGYNVKSLTSSDIDLNYPKSIFDLDFSDIDVLLNCTGHNHGNYQGFLANKFENQLSQITVNFASNLMLLKHYALSRQAGKYVWFNSASIDNPRTFHSVYLGTKMGSKFAIDLIRQEAPYISILEAKIGLTKTNIRFKNFEGTITQEEVDATYIDEYLLKPIYVAEKIVQAIEENLEIVTIK